MTKPWAEPGLSVEERAKRLAGALIVSSRLDLYHPHITEALRQARADALEEAARMIDHRSATDRNAIRRDVLDVTASLVRALMETDRG